MKPSAKEVRIALAHFMRLVDRAGMKCTVALTWPRRAR